MSSPAPPPPRLSAKTVQWSVTSAILLLLIAPSLLNVDAAPWWLQVPQVLAALFGGIAIRASSEANTEHIMRNGGPR